jgi:TolB protein
VTEGQRHWFGTSFGGPDTRGSGSNVPQWSPRENVCTFTRALPDSRTAWQYVTDRLDTDHFNRSYHPELARGGTEICLLDPTSGEVTRLTHSDPPVWDFRTAWSHDAERIAFCRAAVGEASELCVMGADGSDVRRLTRGNEGLGADQPVWWR